MMGHGTLRNLRTALLTTTVLCVLGRTAQAQTFSNFPLPTLPSGRAILPSDAPNSLVTGPDGNLWFVDSVNFVIVRVTIAGDVASFGPTTGQPLEIVAGSDGALWFTENLSGEIGRITTGGVISEFAFSGSDKNVSNPNNPFPTGITLGPDNNIWFGSVVGGSVLNLNRLTPNGTQQPAIQSFPLSLSGPVGELTVGPDNNLWFTETGTQNVGIASTAGALLNQISTPSGAVEDLARGPDGGVWYTTDVTVGNNASPTSKVGRIAVNGTVQEFATPTANAGPQAITAGPDGGLWFSEVNLNQLGRAAVSGTIQEAAIPTSNTTAHSITIGPDNALWFTANGSVGRLSVPASPIAPPPPPVVPPPPPPPPTNSPPPPPPPTGPVAAAGPLVSAVLPTSRSVQVGTTATAFATILNISPNPAFSCSIAASTTLPVTFGYQTTDPANNQISGTVNTPTTIAGTSGNQPGSQSFILFVTPTAAFAPTEIPLTFTCGNTNAATSLVGINTLLLSGSSTPVPDVIALGETGTGDGIAHIPGATGTGAFVVATTNLGSTGSITVTADTGGVTIPAVLSVCETDPATSQCLASPSPSVSTTIAGSAQPTFAVFIQGQSDIPLSPAANRVFLRFTDGSGNVRGSTSVAVETDN